MNKNCPSCQKEVDAALDTCPSCGWKFNSGGGSIVSNIVKPAVRPKIQVEIDLAVALDRTGSSKAFETGIPATFETIGKQLLAKARSVKVWLQSHGDLDENEDMVLHTDGGTVDQAVADMRKVTFANGGDPPEHHLDAIENVKDTIPWTANPACARGAIVAFLTADSKPARSGVSARQLGEAIRSKGLLLYLVCEPTPTLKELVDGACGLMFQISNSPDPAELQKIAGQLAASIAATCGSGGTVPMTVPSPAVA